MPRIITLTPNPALDYAFDAEKIEPNCKLRCTAPRVDPGGGGVNVSRAAQRLGAETLAIFTAGGVFGEALKDAVAREGVAARMISVASPTRPAFHAHETSTGAEYRFNFPGDALTGEEIDAMLAALAEETREGDFVVGSGSLPPGAPDDFWARAARIAKQTGAHFALDSSRGVTEALTEGISLLRLNKTEAPALAGHDLAWPQGYEEFAKAIVARGRAARVAVTHGGDGGILVSERGTARAPAPKVPIVSAVGAGDSFVGALMVALMQGKSDADALRFAFAAAAATMMTPGTALFDTEEVVKLFNDAPPPAPR
jgi:6-phosphofructokinase 2